MWADSLPATPLYAMKRIYKISLLIFCFFSTWNNYAQTTEIKTPEYLYSKEISKEKVDSLYELGWNECIDSINAKIYCQKFYGLPQDYYPIYVEILKKEFDVKVIGVAGCITTNEEYILWTGFNNCIATFTKEKFKKDIFEYSSEFAKKSLPSLESLNKDSVIAQLKYPIAAKNNKISGTVLINGLLDKDGKIKNIKIAKGIGYGCDEEAIRLVKMYRFKPADKTKYARELGIVAIPIKFTLKK